MGLGGLQHYTIEPSDLERTKDFYCDVLGLRMATALRSTSPAIGSIPAAPPRCI
ncbi:extradiol dioxygenase family protein [Bradyrhizobium sp. AZCC 1610]|uniref:VOC family protein n=1 Tax=Bradyrhizobium sp. AZCC 1610 TaxID=3117020 RepID=UPI00302610A6